MFQQLLTDDVESPTFLDRVRHERSWKWWHFLIILLIVFPYISVIVLFALVSQSSGDTTNIFETYVSATLPTGASLPVGTAVSLDSTGQVQKGGGLSIYKDATTISTVCPSYLDVDAVFDSSYLVTYFDSSTQLSNLITVQVDESTPNVATVTAQSTSTLNLYEFITLDQSSGVIVAIAQDTSSTEETAIVVAGSVDSATGAVTLSGSPVSYANEYSVYPQITRLSDSLFAISYYTYDPFYLATRYGMVNEDLSISLSQELQYVSNEDTSLVMNIVGLSDSLFMLLYYNGSSSNDISSVPNGPLTAMLASVDPSADPTASKPLILSSTTLEQSAISYYFSVTQLSNDTAIVAYANAATNGGITALAVRINDALEIVFGSSFDITTGQALTTLKGGLSMDIDVTTLSAFSTEESGSGQFMVLFSDSSNNKAVTAAIGQMTAAGGVIRGSPNFVLNGASTASDSYIWGAITAGQTTAFDVQAVILSVQTNTSCLDSVAQASLSVVEILPTPIGIIATSTGNTRSAKSMTESSTEGIVALAGTVPDFSGLVPGLKYYTNTMGQMMTVGSAYSGRVCSASPNADEYYYIFDEDSNTIVSLDSQVGVASSSSSILIQLKQ